MNPYVRTLPTFLSLVVRRPLWYQCRACYALAADQNQKTRGEILSQSKDNLPLSRKPKAVQQAIQQMNMEVGDYVNRVETGELIDGVRWDQIFSNPHVDLKLSAVLLTHARKAKILTSDRYFILLQRLLDVHEVVPAQLALNAMIEDGIRLSNAQLEALAELAFIEYTLFFRILSLMDFDALDYPVIIPRLAAHTTRMLANLRQSERALRTGVNLGHLMHMVPHMTRQMLEAMTLSTTNPTDMAHAFGYMTRTGILPTMNIFHHFAKHLPLTLFDRMFAQMKTRGLIPTTEMYNDIFLRLKATNTDLLSSLVLETRDHNILISPQAGLGVANNLLNTSEREQAYEILHKSLQGPFTEEGHEFVSQNIRNFLQIFKGTEYEAKVKDLLTEIMANPDKSLSTRKTREFAASDEW